MPNDDDHAVEVKALLRTVAVRRDNVRVQQRKIAACEEKIRACLEESFNAQRRLLYLGWTGKKEKEEDQ